MILAMIIWGLLTGAFITRLIRFPHSVLAEVRHPVLSSFVSLFPATTMLVAIGFVPWFRPLAVCLFSFGVVVQLAYAAWQTAGLWRGSHPEEATTPGLYLPTVANNFISAMACGALGYTDAGLVFLGAGVFMAKPGTGDLAASAQFGRITHGTADITRHSARSCAGGL